MMKRAAKSEVFFFALGLLLVYFMKGSGIQVPSGTWAPSGNMAEARAGAAQRAAQAGSSAEATASGPRPQPGERRRADGEQGGEVMTPNEIEILKIGARVGGVHVHPLDHDSYPVIGDLVRQGLLVMHQNETGYCRWHTTARGLETLRDNPA